MELTIEIVGRGSRHFDLQNVSADRITIGRGFDNDIVLPDPHVCIHHAVIEAAENGGLILHDLDSVNGTYTKDHQAINSRHVFASGDEFIFGKTRLRIYRRDHVLPDSIRLTWVENLAQLAGRPLLAGSVVVLALLMSLLFQYNTAIKEFFIGRELVTAVGILLIIATWPVCWAIFARIRKHDARFLAQMTATVVIVIAASLVQKLHDWLTFNIGASVALQLLINGIYVLLTLLLIWFNYYLSIFQIARQRWTYSIIFTILLTGFTYGTSTFDTGRFKNRPNYNSTLYPPYLSNYSAQSVTEYLKNAETIFDEATAMVNKD